MRLTTANWNRTLSPFYRVRVRAAIQISPEALCGGMIARVRDGDMITIDAKNGVLSVLGSDDIELREGVLLEAPQQGMGRELFGASRERAGSAESGASLFGDSEPV